MNFQPSRRKALAAGGSVLLGALGGCNQLSLTSSQPIELEILPTNFTPEKQLLEITLLRPEDETRDEAVVFDREFELEAGEDSPQSPNPPVVEDERFVVQASLAGYRDVDAHHHHVPDPPDSAGNDRLLEVAVFAEDELARPYIDFTEYAGRSE